MVEWLKGGEGDACLTADSLFDGEVACYQHKDGYRFSIDPVLLAHFCTVKKKDHIVDLGAGCGVIGLIILHRQPQVCLVSFELQEKLYALIQRNREANGFAERMRCVHGSVLNIKTHLLPETVDLVVCNPPYGILTTGRVNLGAEQCLARHEVSATLADFIKAAVFVVKNKGRAAFILPSTRLAELLALMVSCKLEPKTMRLVYSYPGCGAKLVLVEGVKNGGQGLVVQEPLFIYTEKDGPYTTELDLMFAKDGID